MVYKVREVADMVGVSVRTLHHYDQIDLLEPDSVSPAGYRFYTEQSLERLQQILFFKEMGVNLQEIKKILDNPAFNRKEALYGHKEVLLKKKKRLEEMIQTVEKTIRSMEGGEKMDNKDMFKGFDRKEIEEQQAKYSKEAKEKYGKEIVEESEGRVAQFTDDDWTAIMKDWEAIYGRMIDRMEAGDGPEDEQVQAAVAELKQLFTANFYDCTVEIFRGLADLYVTDERFTKNINKYKEGLAPYLSEAMIIFCDKYT